MSVSSTRKVSLSSPSRVMSGSNRSQSVENIDTNNNVLVRDDTSGDSSQQSFQQKKEADFIPSQLDAATSMEALTLSGVIEDNEATSSNNRVSVYSNNQSIIKDEDVERIGRSYLKHFYEKNEPITDVDELV